MIDKETAALPNEADGTRASPATAAVGAPKARSRRMTALAETRISGFVLVLALLALWEVSARLHWTSSTNWPPFSAVVHAALLGIGSHELLAPLAGTLARMLAGFAIGSFLGMVAGLLLGASPLAARAFNPLIEVLRPIPLPAIVPPLILFLGVGDGLKIFVTAVGTFFPVLVNTFGGTRDINSTLLQTAATFRVGRVATLAHVILPASLPAILSGLRVGLGLALVVTITAEMIAGAGGLGYFLVQTQYAMRPAEMYAAVLCLAATGYLLNRGFLAIEARLIVWHGSGHRQSR
ncbi:MAG TPA: ABC transporter permease [Alphaproteobacteria bacterium]|nr:ABC transporter permease [Alphaproteobacteria bacterium]